MSDKFTFTAQLLYILIGLVSIFIAREFWKSRDGVFRKLMIFLFSAQAFTVFLSAAYFLLMEKWNREPLPFGIARLIALLPMSVAMMLVGGYLAKQNKIKKGKYYS